MSKEYDPADPVWHVLTVSDGGTVSLIKNLDEATARNTMRHLCIYLSDNPWTNAALRQSAHMILAEETGDAAGMAASNSSATSSSYHLSAGSIVRAECFGPASRRLDVWPKPADWESRLAAEVAALRVEKAV